MITQEQIISLTDFLGEAEVILWLAIYSGGFSSETMAAAVFDAHKAVKKARSLVEGHLSQAQMEMEGD